jgi:hypothetical protein
MRNLMIVAVLGTLVVSALSVASPQGTGRKVRVGTYDNRAIAVAYAASRFNPVKERTAEYERAKQAGDTERAKELEAWGEAHQRALHRQGFGRVPVGDLLAYVRDRLPELARRSGLDLIAWQVDYSAPDVEVVDVTDELVQLFEPSDRTLATVAEVRKHDPVDLDVIEQGHEH